MAIFSGQNLTSSNTVRQIGTASRKASSVMEKLASGYKINSAKDDPAGLVISEQLRSQTAGLERARKNCEEAMNVLGIAEGALGEMNSILEKMRSLTIHAANSGATSPEEIAANQAELDSAIQTIDRIARTTRYDDQALLAGGAEVTFGPKVIVKNLNKNEETDGEEAAEVEGEDAVAEENPYNLTHNGDMVAFVKSEGEPAKVTFNRSAKRMDPNDLLSYQLGGNRGARASHEMNLQTGDGETVHDRYTVHIPSMTMDALGYVSKGEYWDDEQGVWPEESYTIQDMLSGGAACLANDPILAMEIIEKGIDEVTKVRGDLGSVQTNVLQTNINNINVMIENIVKSESAIRDTDMAWSVVELTTSQVIQQAGTSLLAQSNQMAKNVLHLLR